MKSTEIPLNLNLKKEGRKDARAIRNGISEKFREEWSKKIQERLFDCSEWKNAERVFLYLSFGSEVSTWEIVRQGKKDGKAVFAPKMKNGEIFFYPLLEEKLVKHSYGILEPIETGEPVYAGEKDLVLVPGLLFSEERYRLGYGGGFYDRYLEKCPDAFSMGLAFEVQVGFNVPLEPWDQPLCGIITEKRRI